MLFSNFLSDLPERKTPISLPTKHAIDLNFFLKKYVKHKLVAHTL
jgi:hypothetical protein